MTAMWCQEFLTVIGSAIHLNLGPNPVERVSHFLIALMVGGVLFTRAQTVVAPASICHSGIACPELKGSGSCRSLMLRCLQIAPCKQWAGPKLMPKQYTGQCAVVATLASILAASKHD